MEFTPLQMLSTILFAAAVVHTFLCSRFQHLAHRYPEGSIPENLFHLLGEVEVVFGIWAGVFAVVGAFAFGKETIFNYFDNLVFTEPLFVLAIMTVAATRPVIEITRKVMLGAAQLLPFQNAIAAYFVCLSIGPLLGSLITEPAAMTVIALILRDLYFSMDDRQLSPLVKYTTLATLLVNVSIGGALTHFAAPPVLMVAATWNWDTPFMFANFGWKAMVAVFANAALATWFARKELGKRTLPHVAIQSLPPWLTAIHFAFLAMIVLTAHHPAIFIGLMLFFIGFATITSEFQDSLKIRESLLVAFFLGGLVVFGGLQNWWLSPLIKSLNEGSLFLGATGLTAITDNAALTYLGAQVENVSDSFKYALVAGAITGGGLTVIANAPNPIAFSTLQERFGPDGISPVRLLIASLIPTVIAASSFWFLG